MIILGIDPGSRYTGYGVIESDGLKSRYIHSGYLRVEGHEDEILYFGFGVDDHDGVTEVTPEYEELGLAIVNELLQRMNWIDSGE